MFLIYLFYLKFDFLSEVICPGVAHCKSHFWLHNQIMIISMPVKLLGAVESLPILHFIIIFIIYYYMVIWWEQNLTQNYVETSPFMSFANILLN